MNLFCRLLGHTWTPVTEVPESRWTTTKEGVVLVNTLGEGAARHFDECRRCGERREIRVREFPDPPRVPKADASATPSKDS